MNLEELDNRINTLTNNDRRLFLFRIGSTLDKKEYNDIDYLIIMKEMLNDDINKLPKTSGDLHMKEPITDFYWRVTIPHEPPITIIYYTIDRFLRYLNRRSGPQIYVLHHHKLISGDELQIDIWKTTHEPDRRTATNDLTTLKNDKYTHKFLWAWRSVSILKGNGWLKNQEAITQYVDEHHHGRLHDREYLTKLLEKLLDETP